MTDYKPYKNRASHDFFKLISVDFGEMRKENKGRERASMILDNMEGLVNGFFLEQMKLRRKNDVTVDVDTEIKLNLIGGQDADNRN